MSAKTKIVVLHMKELIYTAIFAVLGILFIVLEAMDLDMYASPSTQRNLATLAADGVEIIEAAEGELASHLVGAELHLTRKI